MLLVLCYCGSHASLCQSFFFLSRLLYELALSLHLFLLSSMMASTDSTVLELVLVMLTVGAMMRMTMMMMMMQMVMLTLIMVGGVMMTMVS